MSDSAAPNRYREYRPPATNAGPRPLLEERELPDVLETVRAGFDRDAFETVCRRFGLRVADLARLLGLVPDNASNDDDIAGWADASTLAGRSSVHDDGAARAWRIQGAAADRLDELVRLGELAVAVFGDEAACAQWFQSSLRALDDARPVDYLDVRAGRRRGRDVLYAIEYGHVS